MEFRAEPAVWSCRTDSAPPGVFRICAVIVTHNPPPTFVDNIAAIAAQVGQVVVVDNGSSGETEPYLQELETHLGCKIIRNHQNLGIAAALNLGIKYAIEGGCNWVVTFDQDSRASDGFISQMLETYKQAAHPEKVAIIAPTYVDRESGIHVQCTRKGNGEIITVLTSGSMMAASTIQILGTFDESLYMDYVDTDFCLRARQKGMLMLQSPAVLSHSLGRTTFHRFLGLRFGVTNHSAERRYYITRNRLRLLRRYARDWPWVWREIKAMFLQGAKIIFVEDDKWSKFRAILAGTADGLRGKTGKQIEL